MEDLDPKVFDLVTIIVEKAIANSFSAKVIQRMNR